MLILMSVNAITLKSRIDYPHDARETLNSQKYFFTAFKIDSEKRIRERQHIKKLRDRNSFFFVAGKFNEILVIQLASLISLSISVKTVRNHQNSTQQSKS